MTAFSKGQRQRMIADWLRAHRVGSQEELVARLAVAGVAATQATVSRDLDEIGAVKTRREGNIRYVMPDEVEPGLAAAKLDRLLAEWVDAIIPSGHLLIIRTPPGSANMVANALDRAGVAEIAGTVAGDDTIFVALNDGVDARMIAAQLRERRGLAEPQPRPRVERPGE